MFNKRREYEHVTDKGKEFKSFTKSYSIPNDVGIDEVVKMIADSNYTLSIEVDVDDIDSYGAGLYNLAGFLDIYDDISSSIDRVYITAQELDCDFTIYTRKRKINLNFRKLREMPATELSDIIQGKKRV
jgi:hypothetical protein